MSAAWCLAASRASCVGITMVYLGEAFDPLAALDAIQAERCDAFGGVPTMFVAILNHPAFAQYDLSSLRCGFIGGSPCPADIMRRIMDEMHINDIIIVYGMTELSGGSTQTARSDSLERRVKTIGRAQPHMEVKLVDPEGRTVPRGMQGEICFRGHMVMRGYWNAEAQTKETIDDGRWLHSGDLGTMDEDDYITITGRSKDMVIRGGENIYPREVEEFLFGHPAVADVQVFGVPDARYRRGTMRLDPTEARCRGNRGGDPRLLSRPHHAFQDSPLCAVRRQLPDDGHRQGAEVRHAGDDDRRARPPRSAVDFHRLVKWRQQPEGLAIQLSAQSSRIKLASGDFHGVARRSITGWDQPNGAFCSRWRFSGAGCFS